MPSADVSRGSGPVTRWSAPNATTSMPSPSRRSARRRRSPGRIRSAANYTDGIVVLHRGRIVYERYFGALTAERPHIAFSVTKSFIGTLARCWWPKASSIASGAGVALPARTCEQWLRRRDGGTGPRHDDGARLSPRTTSAARIRFLSSRVPWDDASGRPGYTGPILDHAVPADSRPQGHPRRGVSLPFAEHGSPRLADRARHRQARPRSSCRSASGAGSVRKPTPSSRWTRRERRSRPEASIAGCATSRDSAK